MLEPNNPKYNSIILSLDFSGAGWVLFFIFLTLKLMDVIDWSWFFVTMPLWVPVAFVIALWILAGLIILIIYLVALIIAAITGQDNIKTKIIKRRKPKDETSSRE